MTIKSIFLGILTVALLACDVSTAAVPVPPASNKNYTFIYFENGYPTRLRGNRRTKSADNYIARENPDVVVQTGFYSLRLDCDDMQLTGYDAMAGSDYLRALNQDVTVFTPAKLMLAFRKDGKIYTCTSGIVQSKTDDHVRLIESGQYIQRFDHTGLVFTSRDGDVIEKAGRLEIAAWADHVTFNLDLSDQTGISMSGIQIISPAGKKHFAKAESDQAVLSIQPHLDTIYKPLDIEAYRFAVTDTDGQTLSCDFDELEYGLRVNLPISSVKFPAHKERFDEFVIEVKNPTDRAISVPLIFNEERSVAITGTSMMLCDDRDGRPLGIPVQVSKNWHRDKEKPVVHEGSWLRGYSMLPMKPGETRKVRLRIIFGYWGGVPAVSYSQLSLIGYGGNWKWDQSAHGCWGESMCYDYSQHLGSAVITDVRPSLTLGNNGRKYEWTENVGGGDFLIYYDADNTFRWGKRLKTAYHWSGPNVTEVHYSGITDDEKIRFNYRVRSVRTGDYHRRFHAYRYQFLKDVDTPERLVFHQMAADYYASSSFENFYIGDETSSHEYAIDPSLIGYAEESIPFNNSWLAIDESEGGDAEKDAAKANRGLISLSSTLNGEPLPIHIHPFNFRGKEGKQLFDMSSDSVSRSYKSGDVVYGELEFIMPPKSQDIYWGEDQELSGRLSAHGSDSWKAVVDEYAENIQLDVTVQAGKLLKNYPIELSPVAGAADVLADFTVQRGGIGHVPIILHNAPAGMQLRVERLIDGKWMPLEGVDFEQNNFYQGVLNRDGTMDYAFNVARPDTDLSKSWRIRIRK